MSQDIEMKEDMKEELIPEETFQTEHRQPIKQKPRRLLQICKLLFVVTIIAIFVIAAFTTGWFSSWITSTVVHNNMQPGSWATSIDDNSAKIYTPVMEIADSEVHVIYSIPGGNAGGIRDLSEEDEKVETGDRTVLKDPITKKPVFTVDREFVRDLPMGHVIDEMGDLTDESFRITITDIETRDRAEIIPFSISLKNSMSDEYATMDPGSNPTFYFQWNDESRAVLKTNTDGEMELVWPMDSAKIEKANRFLERFVELYEPFLKAQKALSLDDEDIYIPPSEIDEESELARYHSGNSVRHFEVNVDGVKRLGWYVSGNCWVTNCRPTIITTIIKVTGNRCGLWYSVSSWLISIIPARCHSCSRCNAKCNGFPPNNKAGCSYHGKCVRGKCQCDQGFAGAKCNTCASRYNPSSYPKCNKCKPKYGGNRCETCAEGYGPCPLCLIKRKCGLYNFDDNRACSGHGDCKPGILFVGQCKCHTGYRGLYCNSCDTNYDGYPNCKCKHGFWGDKCKQKVKCGSKNWDHKNVCSNHGVCEINGNSGTCKCDSGWEGADCQKPIVTCHGFKKNDCRVCHGHGSCISQDKCECNHGYEGEKCEDIKKCGEYPYNHNNVCSGSDHGFCDLSSDSPFCNCNPGWTGDNCEIPSCGATGCIHGSCTAPNTCSCDANYFGDHCEKPLTCHGHPYTDDNVCSGHGNCTGTTEEGFCSCNSDWGGEKCAIPKCGGILADSDAVCNNHGRCEGPNNCICDSMYNGTDCAEPIRCNGIPHTSMAACGTHGKCLPTGLCECNPGFSGKQCSQCENDRYDFSTNCTTCVAPFAQDGLPNCTRCQPGFDPESTCTNCLSGYYKENNQCINCGCDVEGSINSTCTNGVCSCKPGYSGEKCDGCAVGSYRSGEECLPCNCGPHGGTSCETTGQCHCEYGYSGLKCDTIRQCNGIDFNDFKTVCSGHGNCTDQDHCKCDEKYCGPNCEIPKCFGIPANANPCNGHGTCEDVDTCVCVNDFGGDQCEQKRSCNNIPYDSSNVCSGNGQCIGNFSHSSCHCTASFTGKNCDECSSNNFALPNCTTCSTEYAGNNCTDCADKYFKVGNICKSCDCDCDGSIPSLCDKNTGECICRDGRYGPRCQFHCNCNVDGRKSIACDKETGKCECDHYYSGDKCEIVPACQGFIHPSRTGCNDHGDCVGYNNCTCDEGWSGTYCNISTLPICNGKRQGEEGVCNDNGACVANGVCDCYEGYTGEYCEEKLKLCFGKYGDNACSGNGECVEENVCICHSPQYQGSECQVNMVFEDGSDTFTFPPASPAFFTGYGPLLPAGNEIYTFGIEILSNGFRPFQEGIVLGIAGVPLLDTSFHQLGRGPNEFSFSSIDGLYWRSGSRSSNAYSVDFSIGFQLKVEYNVVAGSMKVFERKPGNTEFHYLIEFFGITKRPDQTFQVAVSAWCVSDCAVKFIYE